jgi:hypothetical protein
LLIFKTDEFLTENEEVNSRKLKWETGREKYQVACENNTRKREKRVARAQTSGRPGLHFLVDTNAPVVGSKTYFSVAGRRAQTADRAPVSKLTA